MIHFIEEINMRLWILVMVVSFTPWLVLAELPLGAVSYTHLTLPTTPYV